MSDTPIALVFDPLSWVTEITHDIERAALAERGVKLIVPDSTEERDGLMGEATILISAGIEAVSEEDIASLSTCVGIVVALAGMEHIDLAAAEAAGIPVMNVTVSTDEVADHAMALVLSAVRHLPEFTAAAAQRPWRSLDLPTELGVRRLRGQVMGIVGPGRIGRAVGRRARAFGFETIASRRSATGSHPGTVSPDMDGLELVEFDELCERSDVIVVCATANESTQHLLGHDAFARMKPGVVVVNVARGSLIDEGALADALDGGIVRMAALDVRETEPPEPGSDRLGGHPSVLQTPHVAGGCLEGRVDLRRATAQQAIRFLEEAGRLSPEAPETADAPIDVEQFHYLDEMEEVARTRLPEATYGYVAGGAGFESTVKRNRESLDDLLFRPRVMQEMENISMGTNVLGTDVSMPLIVAPSAVQRMAHPDGELATARAVKAAGLAMILSMNSSTTVEDVAAQGVDFMMQLYVSRDREHMRGIIERAENAGARALVLTVDHAGMPVRLRELRRPLVVPPEVKFVHLAEDPTKRGLNRDLTWTDVGWLRSISSLPVVLKGVLHPEDARIAVENGVDGLIVSNHGGRQLESVVSAYDMIESILEVVDGRTEVLVDGGIRSGTDVLKAAALGARAAMIGRPIWWGLATAGQAGVSRVLEIIRRDLDAAMRLCGVRDVASIPPNLIVRKSELR